MRLAPGSMVAAFLLVAAYSSTAADAPKDGAGPTVILETTGVWRIHETYRPPLIDGPDGPEPALMDREWLDAPTAEPADLWWKPDFDDAAWRQGPALLFGRTPYMARLCLRGRFRVTDPRAARGLRLDLRYFGGVVVRLNGRELARGHLPDGPVTAETLAEAYPKEAFVGTDGKVLNGREHRSEEDRRRFGLRERTLEIPIPVDALRTGANVLAVEVVRSPYHAAVRGQTVQKLPYELRRPTCHLRRIQLLADTAGGLEPNVTRPAGLQVWNSPLLRPDFDLDHGDPLVELQPVRIVAARGGQFSGKIVVGRDAPIEGLRAEPGALKGPGGATIDADRVQVRYAHPWGSASVSMATLRELPPYPVSQRLLSALAEGPAERYETRQIERFEPRWPNMPAPAPGAVVPVWFTVDVPRDLPAGVYRGEATVRADGAEPQPVELRVEVADWTLPAPGDYRSWVGMVQVPDTSAVEYDLDLWSEAHWRMIEKSLKMIGRTGCRTLYVPLICQTNNGNAESMVRWVDRGDGTYDHDFSILDRYIDLAREHLPHLEVVCFNVWEIYVTPEDKSGSAGQESRAIAHLKERGAELGQGPAVTVVGPGDEGPRTVRLPGYADPRSKALWRPLVDELKQRMARRGLADAMMLGTVNDVNPTKAEAAFWREVSGDLPWVVHSHHGRSTAPGWRLHGELRIGYQTRVWNLSFAEGKGPDSHHGWNSSVRQADYERHGDLEQLPTTYWHHMCEFNVTGKHRGIGRLAADFWPVFEDRRGRRSQTVLSRYPASTRRNLDLRTHSFAPGPDGPVATTRFEAFREGVQACEARIVIERALLDEELCARLGADLERRCRDTLHRRSMAMWRGLSPLRLASPRYRFATSWRGSDGIPGHLWFITSGWEDRTAELFALAGEVERKVGGN